MKRRYFIPAVTENSAMDCGPAALKALFGGFGVYLSHDRLREACQTDVDGTSIETIELIAGQLGMSVRQSMVPADLMLLPQSRCVPAIAVVTQADGAAHFVVLWRVHGPWLQVMDPAAGRLWVPRHRFLKSLYLHQQMVPASAWQEWSLSDSFSAGLEARMRALDAALRCWPDRAHQDAALRFAGTLRAAGRLRCGAEARRLLTACAEEPTEIPPQFWAVRRHGDDPAQLLMRGAVLLSAQGLKSAGADTAPLPASLARVRTEPAPSVWGAAWDLLRDCGWLLPTMVALSICAAACGAVLEALLFRALFDLGRHLQSAAERLIAIGSLLVFLATLLTLDWPAALGLWRLGRQLELGLLARFLRKVPRLGDGNFESRSISDMALRAVWLQQLRQLPETAGNCLHLVSSLLITAAAIAWEYPGSGFLVLSMTIAACGVPSLFLAWMGERDQRFRELSAALGAFFLDASLGCHAIQAHCAERNMGAAQARQLRPWAAAGLHQQALFVRAECLQMAITFACMVALVFRQACGARSPAGLLLLIYWSISIPMMGQELAAAARAFPAMRNTLLRFLELINSPEDAADAVAPTATASAITASAGGVTAKAGGIKVEFDDVCVVVGGHTVLDHVTLRAGPGEHIGIVGVSGAGKSSLLGCLLGWHEPASGALRVDDAPLDRARLVRLRRETAWIDPQVHLFRTTLHENLRYGNGGSAAISVQEAVEAAELSDMLRRAPAGLRMPIGEGGSLVSGGEGQRIRAARALCRNGVRLGVLDEPARGLGRDQRRRMLAQIRRQFADATLFCVTHDVADTLGFDRVLILERGRIVEQGSPQLLAQAPGSRYRQLLDEEQAVTRNLWGHAMWRKLRLCAGSLS